MSSISEMTNVDRWLHQTGGKINREALDRISTIVFDGIAAITKGEEPRTTEAMTVLTKTMAMIIGRLLEAGMPDGEEEARGYYASIGPALEEEVARFRRALSADVQHRKT